MKFLIKATSRIGSTNTFITNINESNNRHQSGEIPLLYYNLKLIRKITYLLNIGKYNFAKDYWRATIEINNNMQQKKR